MGHDGVPTRTMRGLQQPFLIPPQLPPLSVAQEPKGVVYTKRWVVDLLLDLAGYTAQKDLAEAVAVEPAAGDGAFLGPMVERLAESCRILGNPISASLNSLIAYEVDEASAERARLLAASVLMRKGIQRSAAEALARGWVRTADYLLEAPNIAADFVVGNPPYVRLEEIPEERAWLYRKGYSTMCGRADLLRSLLRSRAAPAEKWGRMRFHLC